MIIAHSHLPVLASRVRLRVDEAVGDASVVEGVGEAAGQDLVEDGAGAAASRAEEEEVRPDHLHAGLDPRRGVLLGGHVLEMEP